MKREKKDLIFSLGLLGLAVLFMAAMISYSPYDIRFETSSPNLHIRNYVGVAGAYSAWFVFKLVGHAGFLMPILFLVWGIGLLAERLEQRPFFRFLGILLLFCSGSALFSLTGSGDPVLVVDRGGILGLFLSRILFGYFGSLGGYIITITLGILALLVATDFLIVPLVSFLLVRIWNILGSLRKARLRKTADVKKERPNIRPRLRPAIKMEKKEGIEEKAKEPVIPRIILSKPKPAPKKPIKIEPRIVGDYKLPTLEQLDAPPPESERMLGEDLETSAGVLEDTLRDFGIETKVVNISKGPVITRYELQPAPGVKVNRITALSDDIALVMKATTVRIVAPIPGKSAVGVEVPNQSSSLVFLREVLESGEFQKKAAKSKLAMALGKDISGKSVVADLGDMPHLLIAGTTGSGKTVCVNSLIMSMIFNATPDELKFIMVDPKMVELAIYNGLPHLLCPVVTDSKKASGALDWVVNEMEERYKLLAKASVRNIDAFNLKSE
ncbi:MAG: DNA translocase FtsK 4TM domain-containing protein, partial [Candidatus Omnitrophica bacterium]|nr:DNA translocase FtsK 4TM domain-containing protein [Candidatus Omnitrophota bacterium]